MESRFINVHSGALSGDSFRLVRRDKTILEQGTLNEVFDPDANPLSGVE
jgi:hypothetical protein